MWDLPGSGIELGSAALGGGFFTTETLGSPEFFLVISNLLGNVGNLFVWSKVDTFPKTVLLEPR